jgi:hypothetical protein
MSGKFLRLYALICRKEGRDQQATANLSKDERKTVDCISLEETFVTEIKRIGVLSLAKIIGLLYTAIGLIVWFFMGCFMLIGVMAQPNEAPAEAMIMLCFVCFMPLIYGVMGFIGGAIIALLYNLAAGKIGGIEVELAPVVEEEILMKPEKSD